MIKNSCIEAGLVGWLLFLLLVFVPKPLSAADSLEVEGFSSRSMEDAIEQALRQAVEQSAGVFIHSESEMENFILKKDKILSRSQGYIKHYTVLEQSRDRDLFKARLQVEVSQEKIQDDLIAMNILLERLERPKLMMLIKESYKGMEALGMGLAENELTALLIDKGFELVDKQQVMSAGRQDQARLALTGNNLAAKLLGTELGAQYVIVGNAVAQNAGEVIEGTGMLSIQTSLQLRIIQTRTGNILGTVTKSAAAAHISPLVGAQKAFALASDKSIDQGLVDIITRNFQDYLNNGIPLKLHVTGVTSFKIYKEITQNIESTVKVAGCRKNSWNKAGGLLVLDLRFKGSPEDLADLLDGRKLERGSFEVVDLGPERLDCTFNPPLRQ